MATEINWIRNGNIADCPKHRTTFYWNDEPCWGCWTEDPLACYCWTMNKKYFGQLSNKPDKQQLNELKKVYFAGFKAGQKEQHDHDHTSGFVHIDRCIDNHWAEFIKSKKGKACLDHTKANG
jgi:hypothetical protein